MKYRITTLIGLFFAIFACKNAPPPPPSAPPVVKMRGLLQYGGGKFAFRDGANGNLYMLSDSTKNLAVQYGKTTQPAYAPGEPVYAELSGRIYGAAETAVLGVTKIDSVSAINIQHAPLPFEFWCSGTEPFWSLHISKVTQGIYFKDYGTATGLTYPWVKAKTGIDTWTYHVQSKADNHLDVVIKKEPCNDGMSDTKYQYSATIKIGQQTFRGCAVKWGE
jgi:uncharacterized membrane protein